MEKLKKFWNILGIALCFSLASLGGTKKLNNVNNEGSPSAKEAPSSQSVSSGSAPINYGRFSTNCTLGENEFNFENDDLYLFAFKVGQGNFVLLRHQKDVVIVDAGIGLKKGVYKTVEKRREVRELPSLKKIFKGAIIHYVFLTHSDEDHWNYLEKLMEDYPTSFSDNEIKYVLCGENSTEKGLWRTKRNQELKFLPEMNLSWLYKDFYFKSLLPIIGIKVFCATPNTHTANQLSPFIKIEYAGKSILCTGDCEGINFDLLFQRSISLDPIIYYSNDENVKEKGKDLKENFKQYASGDVEEKNISGFAKDYFKFYSDYRKRGMPSLKNLYSLYGFDNKDKKSETLMHRLIKIEQARNAIKTSDIVVLPHHGTCTENSQRLLGYFCGQKEHKQLFIVSSDPKGRDGLPKASTIEMAPAVPETFHHPFLYCRDSLGKQVQLQITKKPILLTEAAENDFQCVKITANREIKIWNGKEKKWHPFNQN